MARVIILLLLVSCGSPVTNTTVIESRTVMNSLWQKVDLNSARSVNLDQSVAAYNASHIDDQWFVIDGEVPTLENAPPCSVFIVDKVTHVPMIDDSGNPYSHENWPRKALVENYTGFLTDAIAANGDLYIDVIPPAPTPPTEDQLYAKYSFYAIDSTGAIMYQDHGYPLQDGWPSLGAWMTMQSQRYQLIVASPENSNVPWTYISGSVYIAP